MKQHNTQSSSSKNLTPFAVRLARPIGPSAIRRPLGAYDRVVSRPPLAVLQELRPINRPPSSKELRPIRPSAIRPSRPLASSKRVASDRPSAIRPSRPPTDLAVRWPPTRELRPIGPSATHLAVRSPPPRELRPM